MFFEKTLSARVSSSLLQQGSLRCRLQGRRNDESRAPLGRRHGERDARAVECCCILNSLPEDSYASLREAESNEACYTHEEHAAPSEGTDGESR